MGSGTVPLQLPTGWEGIDSVSQRQDSLAASSLHAPSLHVAIDADACYKIGTCQHCVHDERGRPAHAWDADGDSALDFERDRYFALLSTLGIVMTDRQAYVCP